MHCCTVQFSRIEPAPHRFFADLATAFLRRGVRVNGQYLIHSGQLCQAFGECFFSVRERRTKVGGPMP
uniref:Uncharacterized protein n=1 Tax=mine drainage metagenome TaxID=410659 RepID=E6PDN6_9ZZZZ